MSLTRGLRLMGFNKHPWVFGLLTAFLMGPVGHAAAQKATSTSFKLQSGGFSGVQSENNTSESFRLRASSPLSAGGIEVPTSASFLVAAGFLAQTVDIGVIDPITIDIAGLNGKVVFNADDEAVLLRTQLRGDDITTLNGVDIRIGNLSEGDPIPLTAFNEFRLYGSADNVFDAGDALLGTRAVDGLVLDQAFVIAPTVAEIVPSTGRFYFVTVVVALDGTHQRSFRPSFPQAGLATGFINLGDALAASDANKATIDRLAATLNLSGLFSGFDNTPKAITALTNPPGLATNITYDGTLQPPVGPGQFNVAGSIIDLRYIGSATRIMTINPPDGPVPVLSGSPLQGNPPLEVSFTEASTGFITSRSLAAGNPAANVFTDLSNPVTAIYPTSGEYTATLTVTGPGGVVQTSLTIVVNSPPDLNPVTEGSADEDDPLVLDLSEVDSEAGTWQVEGINDALIAAVAINGNIITFTPQPDAAGSDAVTLVRTNGAGLSSNFEAVLTWVQTNDPSQIDPPLAAEFSAEEDQTIRVGGMANVKDVDTPALNLVWGGRDFDANVIASVTGDAEGAVFTPQPNVVGHVLVTVFVQDPASGSEVSQEVRLNWTPVNDPPDLPLAVFPADGAGSVSLDPRLAWQVSDPDFDAVTSDVRVELDGAVVFEANGLVTPSVDVSGLESDRTYTWTVTGRDPSGLTRTAVFSFSTESDNRAPVLSEIRVSTTEDQASLTWLSDELADSRVRHGITQPDQDNGGTDDSGVAFVTNHAVTLSGLDSGTWYQLELSSTDPAGNVSIVFSDSFLTLFAADIVPPQFLLDPTAEGVAQESMVIRVLADELVTARVLFAVEGTALADGQQAASGVASEEHNIPLSGLTAATIYQVQVEITDGAGNTTLSVVFTVTTLDQADQTAPINVEGPSARGVTDTEFTIDVTTDEPSTALVSFSLNADLADRQVATSDQLKDNHMVTLSGLPPDTQIFYQVELTDASGNTRVLAVVSVITASAPDGAGPVFIAGPTADAITDESLVLGFDLDEPARVRVILIPQVLDGEEAIPIVREFAELRQSYRIEMTRLTPGTTYTFEIQLQDRFGNSTTAVGVVTTGTAPDITSPQVVAGPFMEGIESFSATVGWGASELCTAIVRWSREDEDGASVEVGVINITALALDGSVRLTGLEPGVEYRLTLILRDAQGNESAPAAEVFTSALVPDILAPILLLGPDFKGITPDGAQIIVEYDEPVDIVVLISTEADLSGARTISSARRQSLHRIQFTNLEGGTIYHVLVRAQDAAGNVAVEVRDLFITPAAADLTPPNFVFQPRGTDISAVRLLIEWQLDEPGDRTLSLSTNPDLSEARIFRDPTRRTDHGVEVRDLEPGVTYFGQVITTDASGNVATSALFSFTMLEVVVITRPLITNGPVVRKIRETSVEIFWRTNVPADAIVEYYGADRPDQVLRISRGSLLLDQIMVLNNLTPGTKHHFNVRSRNADRLESEVLSGLFNTATEPDVLAPVIQGPPTAEDIKDTQVLIKWTTNEAADSKVFFTGPDGVETLVSDPADVVLHSIRLTNLLPGTTYTYRVTSTDQVGNGPTSSAVFSVTTQDGADTTPPEFTVPPAIVGRTQTTLVLRIRTNEPALVTVRYGKTAALELGAVSGIGLETDQEILLAGLEPNTVYFLQAGAVDASNNGPSLFPEDGAVAGKRSQSGDGGRLSVGTLNDDDETNPVIIGGPLSVTVTMNASVIEWSTDEPTDATIVYTANGESFTLVDAEFTRDHSHVLSDLTPGTTYTVTVSSSDVQRNGPTTSGSFTFTTETQSQGLNIISGPTALDVTEDRATIIWTTDGPATTVLDYGTDTDYGVHLEDGSLVQSHSVTLTGLASGTTYHFAVSSGDLGGNVVSTNPAGLALFSIDHQLTTLGTLDLDIPVFTLSPTVEWTDDTAVVSWGTDELSTSRVDWAGGGVLNFVEDNTLTREHSHTLTGLEQRTNYFFRVASIDAAGNEAVWGVADIASLALLKAVPVGEEDGPAFKALQPPGGQGRFITNNFPDTQFPVILSGPRVVEQNTESVTVEWQTDERSDSFVRYTPASGGSERNKGAARDVLQHRVTLTNLKAGEQINFIVASTDPSGNGATKSSQAVTATLGDVDLTPPRFLQEPQISSATNNSLVVRWRTDEPATAIVEFWELGFEDQKLRRRINRREARQQVSLNNLKGGTEYVVRVIVADANQNSFQALTDLLAQTDTAADLRPPRIVDGPQVQVTDCSAAVTWNTDELADSFVDYSNSPYRGLVAGHSEVVTEHTVILTNLTPGKRYFYTVGSSDRSGNGPTETAVANFTTLAEPISEPPPAPANLRVTPGFEVNLLEWDVVEARNFAGYIVYREGLLEDEAVFLPVANNLNETAYTDRDLTNGEQYRYRITAVDRQVPPNESDPSNVAVGTPGNDQAPTAPVVLRLDRGSNARLPIVVLENATSPRPGARLTYTIQVSTQPDFSTIADRSGGLAEGFGGVTRWRVTRSLNPQRLFWFRAQAFDGLFAGPWSSTVQLQPDQAEALIASDDFDGDGAVSFGDFFFLAHGMGGNDPTLDLDLNGQVNLADFTLFSAQFGQHGSSKPGSVQRIEVVEEALLEVETLPAGDDEVTVSLRLIGSGPLTGYGLALSYDPYSLRYIGRVDSVGQLLPRPDLGLELLHEQGDKLLVGEHVKGRLQATPLRQNEIVRLRFALGDQRHLAWLRIEDGFVSRGGGGILRVGQLGEGQIMPRAFGLFQNYPNPFNPSTSIPFAIPAGVLEQQGDRALIVYNALGQLVRSWNLGGVQAGYHVQSWDGRDGAGREVGSGMYLVRLNVGKSKQTRKILLVR